MPRWTLRRISLFCFTALGTGALVVAPAAWSPAGRQILRAAEDTASPVATVEAAVKVLDLRTLPLPEGAAPGEIRQVGSLSYESPVDLAKAFQFHRTQLLEKGWKELPGSMVEATYASGMFQKAGYVVSVTTSDASRPDKPGASRVSVFNFGNVRLDRLPVPAGLKALFVNEATASYVTETPVTDAAAACRKRLLEAGWEPYGSTPASPDLAMQILKQNAVQLTLVVSKAPAQGNRTVISLSTLLLSCDIPAPSGAENLQYADITKTLRFESPDDYEAVAKFYQEKLGAKGWKPTAVSLSHQQDEFKRPIAVQVFRNEAGDMVSLDLRKQDGRTHATLTHMTRDEQRAADKRARDAAEKQAVQARSPQKPLPQPSLPGIKPSPAAEEETTTIATPDTTRKIERTSDNVLQIKVAAGKGASTVKIIRQELLKAGWKEEESDAGGMTGSLTLKNGTRMLTLTFVDTGFTDVTIMVIGIGTKLEAARSDKAGAK